MTAQAIGAGAAENGRVAWAVDPDRGLVTLRALGGVTDDDLIHMVPQIWQRHPDVVDYVTLVDARRLTNEGKYGWHGLRELSRQWNDYARGRDRGRRTAVVVPNGWFAKIVKAVSEFYPGADIRVFFDLDEAVDWLGVR